MTPAKHEIAYLAGLFVLIAAAEWIVETLVGVFA